MNRVHNMAYQEYIIVRESVKLSYSPIVISPHRCLLHIFEYLHIQPLPPPCANNLTDSNYYVLLGVCTIVVTPLHTSMHGKLTSKVVN